MKLKCSRKIHFCAGHRVFKHESKCSNPHGHNYVMWVYAEADSLDPLGRVIDFSVLKDKVGGWVDAFWDHTFLVNINDKDLLNLLQRVPETNKRPFMCTFNPTAENMADHILNVVCPRVLHNTGVTVTKVRLYETENCFAEVTL